MPQGQHIKDYRAKLSGLRSFLRPDLSLARRYQNLLLQREIEEGFARYFHMVSLGDDFRACAQAAAGKTGVAA